MTEQIDVEILRDEIKVQLLMNARSHELLQAYRIELDVAAKEIRTADKRIERLETNTISLERLNQLRLSICADSEREILRLKNIIEDIRSENGS